ncbi:hypothetical protein [uncultured Alistipes sp.]|uniref:hypothetical protein n=1 Tax=uncultured Alistipes sp. TaxID=538949 RepID=UPI0026657058|nr:hypothetical protein [uncultured Alistipes sp.]
MFKLSARIEIRSATKRWTFDKVARVEITRDMDTLTDLCVMTLPRKVRWQGEERMPVQRGDEVGVWLGYDDDLSLAFRGFVTTIGAKTPVEIHCEDRMFRLKQQEARKLAYKSATVEEILRDQNLGVPFRVFGEQRIGQFRVTASTVTELLGQLKDQGGIRSFFRLEEGEPVLYSGVLFEREAPVRQVFATGVNLIDDTQLEVQNAADLKIKVRAISLLPNNKRVRIDVGDADGEKRTLHAYNKTEQELRAWAEQELRRLKQDGLKGTFTTFGAVLIDKLDHIGIRIDGIRRGVYQVQKNIIKYGTDGFRQEITLGQRITQ